VSKKRLTKTEQAADAFFGQLRRGEYPPDFPVPFRMVFAKSRTWGWCPTLETCGETVLARASGCGYDKESACLASALCFLAKSDDGRAAISRTHSAGFRSVQEALAAQGWELCKVYDGKAENGYTVRRTPRGKGGWNGPPPGGSSTDTDG